MSDHDECASRVRTSRTAARIRRKHLKTIDEQPDDHRRLWRAWSWVLAELKSNPAQTGAALEAVTELANQLNERSHQ